MMRAGLGAPVVLLVPLLLLLGSVWCLEADGMERDILQDPLLEWERLVETGAGETPDPPEELASKPRLWRSSDSEPRKYPEYVVVSQDQKGLFKPEKGSRDLPESVRKILLSPKGILVPGANRAKQVEVLCHVDRMYVRVQRALFQSRNAYKHLKLGRCPVNQGTKEHFYLLYYLKSPCGFKKSRDKDFLTVSIDLVYNPDFPVLREVPFQVTLQCKFPRFFHSYKVGFYPKLQGGTVYRALASRGTFSLTPQDASGKDVLGSRTYTLGQLMYFGARGPIGSSSAQTSRVYIDKCYMTTSQKADATPKYTVIDNQGCMVEGKAAPQAAFLQSDTKKVQRFRVAVIAFKTSSSQVFMHCQISLGPQNPTPSAKACNYNPVTKKWKELYGPDSVCSCCDSKCPTAQPKASRAVVSSHSWKVGSGAGSVEGELQVKSSLDDLGGLEVVDERDHLSHWDHQY